MLADGDVGSFDAVLLINQAAIIILNKAASQKYAHNLHFSLKLYKVVLYISIIWLIIGIYNIVRRLQLRIFFYYLVMSKHSGCLFIQIFVAFSEYMTFTTYFSWFPLLVPVQSNVLSTEYFGLIDNNISTREVGHLKKFICSPSRLLFLWDDMCRHFCSYYDRRL